MAPWDRVRWRLQRTVADCLVRMVAGDMPAVPDGTGRDAVAVQDIVGRDVDLGLYYRRPLDIDALSALARDLAGPGAQVTQPGAWGPWVDGGAWLRIDGTALD